MGISKTKTKRGKQSEWEDEEKENPPFLIVKHLLLTDRTLLIVEISLRVYLLLYTATEQNSFSVVEKNISQRITHQICMSFFFSFLKPDREPQHVCGFCSYEMLDKSSVYICNSSHFRVF